MSATEANAVIGAALAAAFILGIALGDPRRRRRLFEWITGGAFVKEVSVDSAPLARIDAVLVQIEVAPGSRLNGVEVGELRLPPQAAVAMVAREAEVFVPHPAFALRTGDTALVVTARDQVGAVTQRLQVISEVGRLAGWIVSLRPQTTLERALGERDR